MGFRNLVLSLILLLAAGLETSALTVAPTRGMTALGNGKIQHVIVVMQQYKWWTDGLWSQWEQLGGAMTSGPAVSSRGSNQLDVFARFGDNALWRKTWNGTAWSGWSSTGGPWATGPAVVAQAGSDSLDIFEVGQHSVLQYLTQP